MERDDRIQAIANFVHWHPESLASQVIRRETNDLGQGMPERTLQEKLGELDDEALTGFYYLVR